MKRFTSLLLLLILAASGFKPVKDDNVEFVCMKTHKATNTCYFNFKIDGGKYSFKDVGCKKSKKRDDIIQQVKEGKIALSRDWKIDCPEPN